MGSARSEYQDVACLKDERPGRASNATRTTEDKGEIYKAQVEYTGVHLVCHNGLTLYYMS